MRIGVFDSGIGGLTVLEALIEKFPESKFIYLGDTANLPYGAKSPDQVKKLSIECAKRFKKKKIDVLVVACNTASSLALVEIQRVLKGIPVHGVVAPGARALLEQIEDRGQVALILATRATVQSQAYGKILKSQAPLIQVIEQACPLLVPLIEEGWLEHPVLDQVLREYLGPYQKMKGVALLACTHYPWIQEAFKRNLRGWRVLNSAQAVANSLVRDKVLVKSKGKGFSLEWSFTDLEVVPSFAKIRIQEMARR